MQKPERKPIIFMGSSQKDLRKSPKAVRSEIGYDLDAVQFGQTPMTAKRFKRFPGVMELVERYDTDNYRAVYVLNIKEKVYVLHCF